MLLDEYWKKRDFNRTPEPRGERALHDAGNSFVIQKHAATRLHYDFRLEIDGVLKSWAVPKGPSLDPNEKRLAVHVEDHPLDYAGFEGIIPHGEYGGGTVMLWDTGTWESIGDARQAYENGSLKFILDGNKLQGQWALVRMRKSGSTDKNDNWLLIKEKDAFAQPGSKAAVVEQHPLSVKTQRDLEQIAAEIGEKKTPKKEPRPEKSALSLPNTAAPVSALPDFIEPQLATLVDTVPGDDDWVYEIKYDGYRILTRIDQGEVQIFTRNAKNWTAQFPSLTAALKALPVEQAWLDGEIICLDKDGKSDFAKLQDALSRQAENSIKYMLFDCMYVNGHDLRSLPMLERKKLLQTLLSGIEVGNLGYSDHIDGNGGTFHHRACELALEGVIAKRPQAAYHSQRTHDWLKIKCLQRQEFVVGGYTEGHGTRQGFGALLIGTYQNGNFHYNGRVGTGFNASMLAELSVRLFPLEREKPPFVDPPKGAMAKGVHWVKPELVIEIEFHSWTPDGVLRHPAFKGLRTDKSPEEVVREVAISTLAVVAEPRQTATQAADSGTTSRKHTRSLSFHADDTVAGTVLSHPEKILFSDGGTKRQLADYYLHIEKWILPHVINRPLTLVRCPGGTGKSCFFQKHIHDALPDSVHTIDVSLQGAQEPPYLWIDSIEGLMALVQIDALEIHTWGANVNDVNLPDRIIFDLDPDPGVSWDRIAEAALLIRNRLEILGLRSFVKVTGGKGLHVVAPIQPELGWEEVKHFCRQLAQEFAEQYPSNFTAKLSKAARSDKIFIDYLRNGRGATAVAAYSSRAKANATVSVPITWEELVIDRIKPDQFTLCNLPQRLQSQKHDPWEQYGKTIQSLKTAIGLLT